MAQTQPLIPKNVSIQSRDNANVNIRKNHNDNSNPPRTQREVVKYVLLTTFTPFFISLIPMVVLYILYKQGLSYDDTVYIKLLNKSNQNVPIATGIICIWTFILFIYNIIEGFYVRCSKYYTNLALTKSYSITSIILLGYILSGIYGSDLVSIVVPGVFLYQFLGIQHFVARSWIFGFVDRILCCTMQSFFKWITIICLIIIPIVISLYVYYNIYDNTDTADTLFKISAIFVAILLLFVPIINMILFVSLSRYIKSLSSLIFGKERAYIKDIFNEDIYFNRKKLTYNKLWRARIYYLFIIVIAVISIVLVCQHIQGIFNIKTVVTQTHAVFANNTLLLSLLTLILFFERPSFRVYLACKNCNTLYPKGEECEICNDKDINTQSRNNLAGYNASIDNSLVGASVDVYIEMKDEEKMDEISMNISTERARATDHTQHFDGIDINCNRYDIAKCEAFQRISKIASKEMLIQNPTNTQFMETLSNISDDICYDHLCVLNDYIHIIDQHSLDEINYNIDACNCNEYSSALELKKTKNLQGIIKLMIEIHVYLYHNIERETCKLNIFDIEYKSNQYVDGKYDDDHHQTKNTQLFTYGFGSFIYYNLLKPNPKFTSFKEEFLNYKDMRIDDWDTIYGEADMRLKTNKAKEMKIKYGDNNILKMQPIQIGDILAVKCYTDLQDLQRAFRASFRNYPKDETQNTTKKIIQKQADQYYFWGKWLNHAISVYGNKINNENIIYYHGLNCKFMFSSLRKDFDQPTSVTTSLSVAQHFAGAKGIILQLQCQWNYNSKWNLSKSLSVEWISYKPGEQEVLLFGNFNQLIISDLMYTIDSKNNNKHKEIITTINMFESLCDGRQINMIYNDQKHDIMKQLIENELMLKSDNYFAKIFDNICQKRRNFAIKTFIMYQNERPDVFMKLRTKLNEEKENEFYCNECEQSEEKSKMKKIHIDDDNNTKCIDCKTKTKILWKCQQSECKYMLCLICSDMIKQLQFILKIGKHVIQIPQLNAVKMNALRVQTLQIMELHRSWTKNSQSIPNDQ